MSEDRAEGERERAPSHSGTAKGMGRRVLLVDDEPSYRDSLSHILSHERYHVRTASCAKSALEVAGEFTPDILIVDWLLRDEMDGVEVAQNLRSANPAMQTIFITGYRTSRLDSQMREVPSARFLSKPFRIDDFMEAIRLATDDLDSTAGV